MLGLLGLLAKPHMADAILCSAIVPATSGTSTTGSGGGGGAGSSPAGNPSAGANGGSGVIILAFSSAC